MADGIVPPTASEGRVTSGVRGLVEFYHAVMAEMKKVTWPEVPDVRRATVAILIFVIGACTYGARWICLSAAPESTG